ncbi:hypothetical protein FC70_GL001274 [Paucilactobacillus oligofermentans DSM 15707 = LMG 22743]|uniref:MmcQ-like protein n=1 Tax=Paucilactobacillus oligofermentans DSM 15707 = LMG 22743 TaxID=1423778 RepID=A0A0R1RFV2_9LACO|nr:MmcQ/YjbR family DNA-binding protein [Paucilactobacillus oligofermentans]KRL55670.1 hypothetical protein FC70_GL001274 [Paucilactobacillus oligofermentans DSM 15707 = LMG 22743]CUS25340.1 Putative uncharacterized protein YyaQ [Paucilactobacillus oligofermentans DSM 15707 = LMG 22743]
MNQRELIDLVLNQTVAYEDYPFSNGKQTSSSLAAVIRHTSNHKTIAIILEKDQQLLLNLKLTPEHVAEVIQTRGVIPGYHMNKTHWVSVQINETDVTSKELANMISESDELTK